MRDLDLIANKHAIGPSDVLLINSLRHWSIGTVVQWLERLGTGRAPKVILILHYTPFPESNLSDLAAEAYKEAFKLIADSPMRSRLALCTDSERLRTEYRSLSDLPITLVPVPHCAAPPARVKSDSSISIVFAGEARSDKGFGLLPSAIREILKRTPNPDLVFNIQAHRPEASQVVYELDILADTRVNILSEPLSEREYETFMANADLVLIPYLENPYKAQTSGVYCEAAALGIPVIVPAGTWMADQVTKNGGGVLFTPGDAGSLADACLQAIQDHALLRSAATRAAPSWRSFHNARNFVACLETLLQSLPHAPPARGRSQQ
jgi:glycosyltransferase involved in cell wall biosynthesis